MLEKCSILKKSYIVLFDESEYCTCCERYVQCVYIVHSLEDVQSSISIIEVFAHCPFSPEILNCKMHNAIVLVRSNVSVNAVK